MSSVNDQLRQAVIGYAVDLARQAADTTVAETQAAASSRTGALRDGINHTEPQFSEPLVVCEIRSEADYSSYQDVGTGIYGPSGARIEAKPGGVLAFDWPAAGGMVFVRSVAGAPGRHFWQEPMPERWANAVHGNA